jgi:hypothetical protein
MQGEGQVNELLWVDGQASAHVRCEAGLVPAPGQYALAHAASSDDPLATPLFAIKNLDDGFVAAPPTPSTWSPGTRLYLRGPLGHGFGVPPFCRRMALVAFECPARTLLSLLQPALTQNASVTLVGSHIPDDLPLEVEAQPLHSLPEVCQWADFITVDIRRELLPRFRELLRPHRMVIKAEGQVLIRTPMPCGALAACGVCTVELMGKPFLVCEEGPVLDLRQVLEWSSRD